MARLLAASCLLASCADGTTAPVESFQGIVEHEPRHLAFELPGRVEQVLVRRGATVAPGDVLVKLDDGLEEKARAARLAEIVVATSEIERVRAGSRAEEIRAASARVRSAKAREAQLERSLRREERLFAQSASVEARVEELASQHEAARAERESLEEQLAAFRRGPRAVEIATVEARADAARTSLAVVEERLLRHTLRAPAPGNVLDIHVEEGEVVGSGIAVVTLADTTRPRADVFVPQKGLEGLHLGTPAKIQVDASESPLDGKIEWISPKTEFTPRFLFSDRERPNLVVRVRVRIEDPDARLHAGVPAFVSFERSAR